MVFISPKISWYLTFLIFKIYIPDKARKETFIFKVMCEGGVIGERVFNLVTNKLIIYRSGEAPLSYKDVCPVGYLIKCKL